jgi:hypothetical protein
MGRSYKETGPVSAPPHTLDAAVSSAVKATTVPHAQDVDIDEYFQNVAFNTGRISWGCSACIVGKPTPLAANRHIA